MVGFYWNVDSCVLSLQINEWNEKYSANTHSVKKGAACWQYTHTAQNKWINSPLHFISFLSYSETNPTIMVSVNQCAYTKELFNVCLVTESTLK